MGSPLIERVKIYLNDAEGIDSALQYRHMKHIKLLMTEVGSWPYKVFGQMRAHARCTKFNTLLMTVGMFLPFPVGAYWYTHADTIDVADMGNTVIVIVLDIMFVQRLILGRSEKYSDLMGDFIYKFHLIHFNHRSEYAKKIFHRIHIVSGAFAIYIIYLLHVGISVYNLIPVYGNYKNGMFGSNRPPNMTFIHSAYYYFPEDIPYKTLTGYILLAVYNTYMSLNIAGMFVSFDLLVYIIVLQIWGHLKILKHSLYSFPAPSNKDGHNSGMYSPEENVHVRRLLSDIIRHHQLIIEFVDKCTFVFGDYLFMFYAVVQIISCILLLEMSAMTTDVVTKFAALFCANFVSLVQCSVLFELLNTKSTELIDAVYHLPWECMDAKNRKTVGIFLHRSQTPLSIKAGKVVPVGVQTMMTVLKTSCSYFMLLLTLTTEE